MCMDESPQMTLSGVYAPTVNESETITDAQRTRSPQGRARSGQLDLADRVPRTEFVGWIGNSPHFRKESVKGTSERPTLTSFQIQGSRKDAPGMLRTLDSGRRA